jgi:Flp pilus assembly protein TadD
MVRFAPAFLAAALALSGIARSAELPAESFASAIERAIDANRLIQAEAMLDRTDIVLSAQQRQRLEALLLLAMHRDAEALSRFAVLIPQLPDDCRLQAGAGIAALRLGRMQEAEPKLLAATVACPDRSDAWGALAVLEDKEGRWDRSTAAYSRAIALSADDPALLNNAGVSMLSRQRYGDAVRLFRQALLLDPANERAKNNLDIARVASGERPSFDAEDDSRRRAERLNNAGYAALLAGDDIAATGYFDEAIRTNPFRFDTAEANLKGASDAAAQATP